MLKRLTGTSVAEPGLESFGSEEEAGMRGFLGDMDKALKRFV
jgi:hypothetical protein